MGLRVRETGKSESLAVMARIGVQTLPHPKGTLTSGGCWLTRKVEQLETRCSVDKKWRLGTTTGAASQTQKGLTNPTSRYRQGLTQVKPALSEQGLPVLEPCAMKVASTVLRGGGGGNAASLPD